jgi:predicted enzyme related to lactoylglutathione lyase
MDMPNPVVHWEIQCKDPDKTQQFYSKLFGWHTDSNNPFNYCMVDTHAEGGINGGIGGACDGSPSRVTFYVQVDDLQAYLDKATKLGGKTVMPPTEIPNVVTLAHFADPEGNVIGLVKDSHPAEE